jgi:hypothetical protein
MSDTLGPRSEKGEEVPEPTKREWQRPELQKLPIAATAEGSKIIATGNDGSGGGKGDTSSLMS